jgi:hypothetical protein
LLNEDPPCAAPSALIIQFAQAFECQRALRHERVHVIAERIRLIVDDRDAQPTISKGLDAIPAAGIRRFIAETQASVVFTLHLEGEELAVAQFVFHLDPYARLQVVNVIQAVYPLGLFIDDHPNP